MRTHNRSENGRSARVALCAHPTHIDNGTLTSRALRPTCSQPHMHNCKRINLRQKFIRADSPLVHTRVKNTEPSTPEVEPERHMARKQQINLSFIIGN
jgi:hypothetical protein